MQYVNGPTPPAPPGTEPPKRIGPQPGPQEVFLRKRWVDIIFYGGAAGGGKSYGLLLDAAIDAAMQPIPGYGAVIFRQSMPQITQTGGLWDTSLEIFPYLNGKTRQNPWLGWEWPEHRTSIRFGALQHEEDKLKWQGSQLAYIGFDEATHFTESQFFYLLSRNRSPSGAKTRVRATTNPDPDSWVKRFLAPWVDDEHPDPAASGEVRYFYREGDTICWLHKPSERPPHIEREQVHSVTFIESRLEDNPALLERDPGYRGRLHALSLYDRTILLGGKLAWKAARSGNTFKREWFRLVEQSKLPRVPTDFVRVVRRWDLAATEPKAGRDPDYTVGVKLGRTREGDYYVLDVVRVRLSPGGVERIVAETAALDGQSVHVYIEQEPGASGKILTDRFIRVLAGYPVHAERVTGDKELRAAPFSAQVEAGHVYVAIAPWTEAFLNELVAFPQASVHDDQVDACAGAFNACLLGSSLPASAHDQLLRPSQLDGGFGGTDLLSRVF